MRRYKKDEYMQEINKEELRKRHIDYILHNQLHVQYYYFNINLLLL